MSETAVLLCSFRCQEMSFLMSVKVHKRAVWFSVRCQKLSYVLLLCSFRCQEMSFVECQTSQTCCFVQCLMSETVDVRKCRLLSVKLHKRAVLFSVRNCRLTVQFQMSGNVFCRVSDFRNMAFLQCHVLGINVQCPVLEEICHLFSIY